MKSDAWFLQIWTEIWNLIEKKVIIQATLPEDFILVRDTCIDTNKN